VLALTTANLREALEELHAKYKPLREGQVATYIPELGKANPDDFGIAAVTAAGEVVEVGDSRKAFTAQSIAKPFLHALALQDHGRDFVLSRVGVEPTGDAFNHIKLDERSKRPYNPMVNAGAIAMASLVRGNGPSEKLNRMLAFFEGVIGRKVMVDMSVFMSERSTGHRNRAMAYLMLNFGMIEGNIEEALDLYFQECSILVDTVDLATMAASLACRGVNPVTEYQALDAATVKDVLGVMFTCGMYDYAGEWAYRVGMPAKSGVGGGLIAVAPGQLGIAVYSPPLDHRGNSVRAIKVCEELSARFGLHVFETPAASSVPDLRLVDRRDA
jgi:glutaminase